MPAPCGSLLDRLPHVLIELVFGFLPCVSGILAASAATCWWRAPFVLRHVASAGDSVLCEGANTCIISLMIHSHRGPTHHMQFGLPSLAIRVFVRASGSSVNCAMRRADWVLFRGTLRALRANWRALRARTWVRAASAHPGQKQLQPQKWAFCSLVPRRAQIEANWSGKFCASQTATARSVGTCSSHLAP